MSHDCNLMLVYRVWTGTADKVKSRKETHIHFQHTSAVKQPGGFFLQSVIYLEYTLLLLSLFLMSHDHRCYQVMPADL